MTPKTEQAAQGSHGPQPIAAGIDVPLSSHPGVQALREKCQTHWLIEFAQARPTFELAEPRKSAVPHIWKWDDYHALLQEAAGLLDVEDTFRRSFMFSNPGLFPQAATTPTLDGACSLYNAGETAPVHRHSPSASRFGLQGVGGFSIVEGEKCTIGPGDVVITPAGTWHDFGNEGDEQILFIDVVNDPLCLALGGTFYEADYREKNEDSKADSGVRRRIQTVREPLKRSESLYATGGVVPKFLSHERGWNPAASPMFVYRYDQTRETLDRLSNHDGGPYQGIIVEYVNPATGASAMPTMSFHMQLLRPGEKTLEQRRTGSTVCCGVEGSGVTTAGVVEMCWERNDVFVVPTWTWVRHENRGKDDAIIYSVSDEPAMRKLGLYRAQGRQPNGEIVEIVTTT